MASGFFESCGANVVATLVVDYLVKPIDRRIRYLRCFHKFEQELQKQQKELADRQEEVDVKVNAAQLQIQTQVPLEFVTNWLDEAKNAQKDVESLKRRIEENKKCCCNLCPNWCWRYQLSKDIEKKTGELVALVRRSNFEVVGRRAELPALDFMASKDLVPSKSSTEAFNKIMKALQDDGIKMIGVWGTGGVGKTTLVTQVGNQVKESRLFDKVIKVVVSQTQSIEAIQYKIADFLDLKFEKTTNEGKAGELWLRLEKEEKLLIILDDLWNELNLKDIGIPVEENPKTPKCCKIIFTTRSKRVCEDMGCQHDVQIRILEDDEAWELFKMKAELDERTLSKDSIKEAKKVAAECKGLPVAIVTLARALKRFKEPKEWEYARKQLRSRLREIGNTGGEKEENAFVCIEMSYSYLKERDQIFFLLCSLFPEDHSIYVEELVHYAWGLGWGSELYQANSVEEMRRLVLETIHDLQDSCLLLEDTQGHVKLHDIVREAALWIASIKGSSFTINSPSESRNERLECCTAISLFDSEEKGKSFPVGLACTNLEILLLKNYDVRGVRFQGMKELKVLSLERSSKLPLTFDPCTSLGKLRVLRVKGFDDLSSLGNLRSLEILRLRDSTPQGLGRELVKLKKLKILDIARCRNLEQQLHNVISELDKLEELFLRDIFIGGENSGILENINSLTCLKALYLWAYFPKGFVFQPKLERFAIDIWTISPLTHGIGNPKFLSDEGRSLKILGVNNFNPVSVFLEKIESLSVSNILDEYVTCLSDKTPPESVSVSIILQHIKDVRISSCRNLKSVFQLGDVEVYSEPPLLSNLKSLHLERIYELRQIWELPIQHVRFESLVVLSITSCEGLESVFSVSLARSLAVLETLKITFMWFTEANSHRR